jgi:hydrogenase maturation protease
VLVAGIGNIFFGDDGFGVAVARRLAEEQLPDDVKVADFGIRGIHLSFELLDGPETTILVDALPRGGTPGSVYLFEPETDSLPAAGFDAHSLDPATVLGLLKTLGGTPGRVVVVGCEPLTVEEGIGLSEPVSDAVEEAAQLVLELVRNNSERS